MKLGTAVLTELLKLRRARVVWILAAAYALAPLMVGLMMSVLLHPALGHRLGLLTLKAQLTVPAANWATYLGLVATLSAGGLVVLAVAQAFVFGREYAEGTAKDMLALPVPRVTFLTAKLAVSALWFVATAAAVYAEALVVGAVLGLPGYAPGLLAATSVRVAATVAEVVLAGSVAALLAVAGRGYLAPIGVSILLLLIGDLFAHSGWGPWLPWSMVLLTAGAAPGAAVPGPASLAVLAVFFLATAAATWWAMSRTDVP
ncbi:MAG: ABC transporter permease [Deinococcales bacterium]|jgi:ABC-2 type transport system permease protein